MFPKSAERFSDKNMRIQITLERLCREGSVRNDGSCASFRYDACVARRNRSAISCGASPPFAAEGGSAKPGRTRARRRIRVFLVSFAPSWFSFRHKDTQRPRPSLTRGPPSPKRVGEGARDRRRPSWRRPGTARGHHAEVVLTSSDLPRAPSEPRPECRRAKRPNRRSRIGRSPPSPRPFPAP